MFTCTTPVSRTTVNTAVVTRDADGSRRQSPVRTEASPGLVAEPCDVGATDIARVVVRTNTSPGGNNVSPGYPPMPNTGVPPGITVALMLGLGAVIVGVARLYAGRRRPAGSAPGTVQTAVSVGKMAGEEAALPRRSVCRWRGFMAAPHRPWGSPGLTGNRCVGPGSMGRPARVPRVSA